MGQQAPFSLIQPSFAGGEFTPALGARVDIQKYLTGLKTARNVNILPQGGLRNRPGTYYVATAGDSTKQVRLIPFIASTSAAYIIELGDKYARFYTADAQVQQVGSAGWITLTPYVVGNLVTQSGLQYYCLVAHTSGTFATDLAAGKWVRQDVYQIPTPWAATDIFKLKFAQSADVMYFAHPSYAPQMLTFTNSISWAIATYTFLNGPFMLQNTDATSTITASALTGSVTLTAAKSIFAALQVGALFEMIWTVVAQTTTPSLTASVKSWIPTKAFWQAVTTGTWSGTILIQTSPDNITWTTVSTVTSNGTVSGTAAFTDGFMRAIMQSALSFSGTATVVITGNGDVAGPTTIHALNAATTPVACGGNATITLTALSGTGDTVVLQKSTDAGATWTACNSYTTNQAATVQGTGETACLIRAIKTVDGGGSPVATVNGTAAPAPTLSVAISTANVSAAIQCGANWNIITNGTWTGKILVEVSIDGGNNWQLVATLSGGSGTANFNTAGQTGFSQCLLRVESDQTVAFTGTASIDLTSSSTNWTGVLLVTAFTSATQVTATVQNRSNADKTGLANTAATYQWSEGSWSNYRGWPSCLSFFQDRLVFAGTSTEPATGWATKTANYTDYGISSPIVDSDGLSFVLPSRQLNAIQTLQVMPTSMLALTSDSEWGIAPGASGVFAPTSISVSLQGHRGSAYIDPVVIGNEMILIQQMGTVIRNLIFQLAVQGYDGENVGLISQHLFTGYSISAMAYQQEPDSIVWLVRSDGSLLSLTYMREQEMRAWARHDTVGSYESVACIPNATLGINEVWFVVNRTIGGVTKRFIERMAPRDQGTTPSSQFFVDSGLTYSGAAATVISGLTYLNGQTVAILADGNVVPQQVVSGGQVTIPNAASVVTVGLPYVSDVETLRVEGPNQSGTLQGRRVMIPEATLRFYNSRGGYIRALGQEDLAVPSTSISGFDEVFQREQTDGLDVAIPLKTLDYKMKLDNGYDFGSHVFFRQVDPLPFTLLALIPKIVPGDT